MVLESVEKVVVSGSVRMSVLTTVHDPSDVSCSACSAVTGLESNCELEQSNLEFPSIRIRRQTVLKPCMAVTD